MSTRKILIVPFVCGTTQRLLRRSCGQGAHTQKGKSFDYKLWFSDVYAYARTPWGWRYVFGQAWRPLKVTP
jgi:hypothetical protein